MMEVELGVSALAGIAVVSFVVTAGALLVVRRWSNQEGIAQVKRRSQAHLLEFRIFRDDPVQILRSQRALVMDQLQLARLWAGPLLILAIPMIVVLWQLDALYGRAPLRVGKAAIVSADQRHHEIAIPAHVTVETKPVYARATNETNWRIRARQETSGMVVIGSTSKRLVAGSGIAYLPEPLFSRATIAIGYPRARVLGLHWAFWFAVFSLISAFALRRPLKVAF